VVLDLWGCGLDTAEIAARTAMPEADVAYLLHADRDAARGVCSYGPLAGA
jgi:hypothetical protein